MTHEAATTGAVIGAPTTVATARPRRRRWSVICCTVMVLGLSACGVQQGPVEPAGEEPTPGSDSSAEPTASVKQTWASGSASPRPASGGATPSKGSGSAPARWSPTQGLSWTIRLSGASSQSAQVTVVDGLDATAAQVRALKTSGSVPVCYINAGALEDWRPDVGRIPTAAVGKDLAGWPGEKWLDTRRIEALRPVMAARFDQCRSKGFAAVDPDNVDGHDNDSGFPLTAANSAAYVRMLVELAHQRGLSVGLKNAVDLLPTVGPLVDFAVNEQCQEEDECQRYDAFTASGKPVLNIEYQGTIAQVCAGQRRGFATVLAPMELNGPVQQCR